MRKGDYKLLYYYKTGETKLYNLREDISEMNDLSKADQARTEELLQLLKSWLVEVEAKFPSDLNVDFLNN